MGTLNWGPLGRGPWGLLRRQGAGCCRPGGDDSRLVCAGVHGHCHTRVLRASPSSAAPAGFLPAASAALDTVKGLAPGGAPAAGAHTAKQPTGYYWGESDDSEAASVPAQPHDCRANRAKCAPAPLHAAPAGRAHAKQPKSPHWGMSDNEDGGADGAPTQQHAGQAGMTNGAADLVRSLNL